MATRPMTANSEQAYRQYKDINQQLDSLKSERDRLMDSANEESEVHQDLLQKIQQLDSEISSKESVLIDIRGKNPKLKEQFDALKRRMSETAQVASQLILQNQQQREQNAQAQQVLFDLKAQLFNEEKRRATITSQLQEIKELLNDDALDDETRELLEARLMAAEESIQVQEDEKKNIKEYLATHPEDDEPPRSPTRESALDAIRDKEQQIIQEGRHRRSPSRGM